MLSLIVGALLWTVQVDGTSVCDPSQISRAALQKTDVAPSLRIEKVAKGKVGIAYVYTVSGPCAPLINGLIHAQASLQDGTIIDFDAQGKGSVRREDSSLFSLRTPPSVVPDVPRATFGGAALIGFAPRPPGSINHYIGFWHQDGGALIATFEVVGGRASKPRPVLRSRVPVRGIGFFPAPDTPSGLVGLVQDTSPTVRLLTLEWNHRDWFGHD